MVRNWVRYDYFKLWTTYKRSSVSILLLKYLDAEHFHRWMSAIFYHDIEDTIMNNLYEEFMMVNVTEGGVYNCRSRITEIFPAKKNYFSIKLISFYFFLDYTLWFILKTKKYQNILCTNLIITEEKWSEIKSLRLRSKLASTS